MSILIPLGAIAAEVAADLTHAIIDDNEHDAEAAFTQAMCAKMLQEYPAYNVMVCHSPFTQNFTEATHQHYELPLTWPRTQGYEIYTFKSGDFWLQGDGGFENWCFGGKFVRDGDKGSHVLFSDPAPQAPPPPPPPPAVYTDCFFMVNSLKGTDKSSGIAWYPTIPNPEPQQPAHYLDILKGDCVTWEGKINGGTFPDGNQYVISINAGSQTTVQGTLVGWAKNNYRTFQVYKDNFRVIYTVDGWEVHTVYYAK